MASANAQPFPTIADNGQSLHHQPANDGLKSTVVFVASSSSEDIDTFTLPPPATETPAPAPVGKPSSTIESMIQNTLHDDCPQSQLEHGEQDIDTSITLPPPVTETPALAPVGRPASTIESMIQNMLRDDCVQSQLEHSCKTEELWFRNIDQVLNEGDTLVFIDYVPPSSQATGSAKALNCRGVEWTSKQFRMASEALLRTESTIFVHMLSPSYQFRILRRRKLVNKLPEGVKFVMDLTPPGEGDELVFQMTELSLTPGLMNWWKSEVQINNSPAVVGGHDDVCHCEPYRLIRRSARIWTKEAKFHPDYWQVEPDQVEESAGLGLRLDKNDIRLYRDDTREWVTINQPPYRTMPDYCHVRHRACLVRLMLFIANKDLILNSAPRLWTMVGLAKMLDCSRMPALRSTVLSWLMADINAMFVERLPEEAAKIAFALELPDVAKQAFSVLVNERAVYEAGMPSMPYAAVRYTVFGRKKEDPGDDINSLVAYAAEALIERVRGKLALLSRQDVWTSLGADEAVKLKKIREFASAKFKDAQLFGKPEASTLNSLYSNVVGLEQDLHSMAVEVMNPQTFLVYDEDIKTIRSPLFTVPDEDIGSFRSQLTGLNNIQIACLPFFFTKLALRFQKTAFNLTHYQSNEMKTKGRKICRCLKTLVQSSFIDDAVATELGVDALEEPVFSFHGFRVDAYDKLRDFCQFWYTVRFVWNSTHRLLDLASDEMQYLPLWAGGNNDGSGGVFERLPPPAALGPIGPGPAYHTGYSIPSDASSSTGSVVRHIGGLELDASTVSSGFVGELERLDVESNVTLGFDSLDAQDSNATTAYHRERVVAMGGSSVASEKFSDSNTADFDDARFAVPADHQPTGQSLEQYVEAALEEDADRAVTPTPSDAMDDDSIFNDSNDGDYDDLDDFIDKNDDGDEKMNL